MSDVPYTPFTGKIQEYFAKIQESEVPEKVDREWLKSAGYRSGYDYYIIGIWKKIGFLDNDNVPTDYWRQYKVPLKSRAVMAQAIREGYQDLFKMYSDAYRKDDEAIYSFIMGKTSESDKKVKQMLTIFRNLVELADFEADEVVTEKEVEPVIPVPVEKEIVTSKIPKQEIHINIQLHLPPTDDITVYDNLFKSMKKYLLSDDSE